MEINLINVKKKNVEKNNDVIKIIIINGWKG